jgi:Flp pilus assembly protein TadD
MMHVKSGLLAAWLLFSPGIVCPGQAARAASIYPKIPVPVGEVPQDDSVRRAAQLVADRKPDEALAVLRGAAKAHPDWPPLRLILARMHSSAGQAPQTLRSLELAAAEAPDDPRVYQCFAALALADGRLSDARLNCEKMLGALEQAPARLSPEVARGVRREARAGLVAVAESRDDWQGAEPHFRAWLVDDPKNAAIRRRFGLALFRNGKVDEAFRELKQARADDPKLDPAGLTMAWLYGKAGDAGKAGEWFAYAQTLDPRDVRIPLARARWLIDVGRPGEARAAAAEAEKLDPGSRTVAQLRGVIAWHLHDFAAAERTLEEQHRESPGDLVVADLLARSLIEQDDPAKHARGLELAEVNARQAPRSPEALTTLGRAHYRLGHRSQAETLLRACIVDGQSSADAAYFLARLLADGNRNNEARALLEPVAALRGGFVFKEEAQQLLEALRGGHTTPHPPTAGP